MGHTWVNVFYVLLTPSGTVTVTDLQALATTINTSWSTALKTYVPNEVTMTQIQIDYIPASGETLQYVSTVSNTGTGGAGVTDAGACVVVDFVISERYRGGHPRMYLPGAVAGVITNGSDISGTSQTNAVSNVNALRNAINGFTSANVTAAAMGCVRFASHNAWLSPPRFLPYTSVKIGKKGKLGSQRRRILA